MTISRIREPGYAHELATLDHRIFVSSVHRPMTIQKWERLILRPDIMIWVALGQNPKLFKGFLVAHRMVDAVEIDKIGVLPEMRRQSLGIRLLLSCAKHICTDSAIHSIFLEVKEDNEAAQKFYEKIGFSANRIRRNYYADSSDAIEMSAAPDAIHENIERIARGACA